MAKKKRTYQIKIGNPFLDGTVFESCTATPLHVIKINGQDQNNDKDFNTLTPFPNPAANYMIESYEDARKIMGEKLATTIIEYQDKVTGETAVTLFPCNETVPRLEACVLDRLNHDSRKDLNYQINLRTKIYNKYMQSRNR